MTRGYYVFESKGKVTKAAYIASNGYISGAGYPIIKAFSENREEEYLEELRQQNVKYKESDELVYIRPEWYRKTKNSRPDDMHQEYAYVITAGKLKIYNYAKLLATITKDTAVFG